MHGPTAERRLRRRLRGVRHRSGNVGREDQGQGLPQARGTAARRAHELPGALHGRRRLDDRRSLGDLKAGQKLLVLGGSSGTGLFAIQLAKSVGASVACTASTNKTLDGHSKLDVVKSMGADVVIDYKTQEWATELAGKEYDMILDCVGDDKDWVNAPKVLKKGGLFVSLANFTPTEPEKSDATFAAMIVKSSGEDLRKMVTLAEAGKLKVCIDAILGFDQVKEALSKSLTARSGGKIIIDVGAPPADEGCLGGCVVA